MGAHLLRRLAHPHYLLNALFCLPLPLAITIHLINLSRANPIERNTTIAIALSPIFVTLALLNTNWSSAEDLLESSFWLLQLFNTLGLVFLRKNLGTSLWLAVIYVVAWIAISFFAPQPPYLGPSKLNLLTTEEFDEQIAIVPPAPSLDLLSSSSSSLPKISELLPNTEDEKKVYDARRKASKTWQVVLFHADWIRKSRELEITLSRLSYEYTSPLLSFHFLTPESAPQTFYDLNLSTSPTTMDLPTLFLFHKGQPVAQLPKGLDEVESERKLEKQETRRRRKNEGSRRKGKAQVQAEEEEDEEDEDDSGSDGERETERRVALARYRWDRSGEAIVKAFKLKERSGLVPPPSPASS